MGSEGAEKQRQGSMAKREVCSTLSHPFKLVRNPEFFFLLFAFALTLANIRDTDNVILLLDPRTASSSKCLPIVFGGKRFKRVAN